MKEELLKSVAQPMQIFYAPFGLFMGNVVITVVLLAFFPFFGLMSYLWVPIILFVVFHGISILIGRKEPHIDSIIASRSNIRTRTKNILRENGNKFTA